MWTKVATLWVGCEGKRIMYITYEAEHFEQHVQETSRGVEMSEEFISSIPCIKAGTELLYGGKDSV